MPDMNGMQNRAHLIYTDCCHSNFCECVVRVSVGRCAAIGASLIVTDPKLKQGRLRFQGNSESEAIWVEAAQLKRCKLADKNRCERFIHPVALLTERTDVTM